MQKRQRNVLSTFFVMHIAVRVNTLPINYLRQQLNLSTSTVERKQPLTLEKVVHSEFESETN